jgi:hypothetical protein
MKEETYTNTSMSRYIPPLFISASNRITYIHRHQRNPKTAKREDSHHSCARNASVPCPSRASRRVHAVSASIPEVTHPTMVRLGYYDSDFPPKVSALNSQNSRTDIVPLRGRDSQIYPLWLDIHQRAPHSKVRIKRKLVPPSIIPPRLLQPIHIMHDVRHQLRPRWWTRRGIETPVRCAWC